MPIQTTFNLEQGGAFAGALADTGYKRALSRQNEETVDIPFGVLVKQGTADRQALLYDAAGANPLGVVIHTHALSNAALSDEEGVEASGGVMRGLRMGAIFVLVETGDTGVVAGGAVYARHTAGAGEQLGSFRSDSDGGDATLIPGLEFGSTAAAGETAVLEVNLPNLATDDTPVVFSLSHASLSADTTAFLMEVPAGKTFILDDAKYHNVTGLAADAANFFNIKVQMSTGPVVAANWSTETGQEGTIAADAVVDLVNGALANRTFEAGERLEVLYDEDGTATLPIGTLQVTGRLI